MNDKEAFLTGIKPSLFDYFDKQLKKFPHIKISRKRGLFFQEEERKQLFQPEFRKYRLGSKEFNRTMGMALGYPPKAIDYFIQTRHAEDFQLDQVLFQEVSVHYAGWDFVSGFDDIIENVNWMWDTYRIDELLELSYVGTDEDGTLVAFMVPVQYQNQEDLMKQVKAIQNKLEEMNPVTS